VSRLEAAFAAIDAENAGDPVGKEQDHAERAVQWIRRLRPDAPEELLLAARGHHVRRWEIPRSAEPDGREGYLRWKRRLQQHHADVLGRVLGEVGYDDVTVERVQAIVTKRRLKSDADVISLEDALALVFLETQLVDFAETYGDRLGEDHLVEVLVKTLRKMTPDGHAAAAGLAYDDASAALVQRAVASL
jgi:hypothetical protein